MEFIDAIITLILSIAGTSTAIYIINLAAGFPKRRAHAHTILNMQTEQKSRTNIDINLVEDINKRLNNIVSWCDRRQANTTAIFKAVLLNKTLYKLVQNLKEANKLDSIKYEGIVSGIIEILVDEPESIIKTKLINDLTEGPSRLLANQVFVELIHNIDVDTCTITPDEKDNSVGTGELLTWLNRMELTQARFEDNCVSVSAEERDMPWLILLINGCDFSVPVRIIKMVEAGFYYT